MKQVMGFILIAAMLLSCNSSTSTEKKEQSTLSLQGTWGLISGTTITKGDTVITDYTKTRQMIKIINADHFAFLLHDFTKGKDSSIFSSGGGRYTLIGDQYTEYLDYCSDQQWEGNTFPFTVTIKNDTLIQSGIEKVEAAGIERMNIEKYQRVKN